MVLLKLTVTNYAQLQSFFVYLTIRMHACECFFGDGSVEVFSIIPLHILISFFEPGDCIVLLRRSRKSTIL